MNKVRIISDEEELIKAGKSVKIDKTRCFVNNVEIPMVISADFHASVDEVPEWCGIKKVDSLFSRIS